VVGGFFDRMLIYASPPLPPPEEGNPLYTTGEITIPDDAFMSINDLFIDGQLLSVFSDRQATGHEVFFPERITKSIDCTYCGL
jgi:hypothetical protein